MDYIFRDRLQISLLKLSKLKRNNYFQFPLKLSENYKTKVKTKDKVKWLLQIFWWQFQRCSASFDWTFKVPLFFNIYICDLFFCIVDLDIGSYTGGNTLYICFADLDFTLKKVKRL